MGTSNAFLLADARSDLGWLDEAGVVAQWPYRSGARVWVSAVTDEDVFWDRMRVLQRLTSASGTGALVGLSLDSDFLGIVGRGPNGVAWSGAVDGDAALDYRNEGIAGGYRHVVPEFDTADLAVTGAVAWSERVDLAVDVDKLLQLFSARTWDRPADQYWSDLLSAFGLTPIE